MLVRKYIRHHVHAAGAGHGGARGAPSGPAVRVGAGAHRRRGAFFFFNGQQRETLAAAECQVGAAGGGKGGGCGEGKGDWSTTSFEHKAQGSMLIELIPCMARCVHSGTPKHAKHPSTRHTRTARFQLKAPPPPTYKKYKQSFDRLRALTVAEVTRVAMVPAPATAP